MHGRNRARFDYFSKSNHIRRSATTHAENVSPDLIRTFKERSTLPSCPPLATKKATWLTTRRQQDGQDGYIDATGPHQIRQEERREAREYRQREAHPHPEITPHREGEPPLEAGREGEREHHRPFRAEHEGSIPQVPFLIDTSQHTLVQEARSNRHHGDRPGVDPTSARGVPACFACFNLAVVDVS